MNRHSLIALIVLFSLASCKQIEPNTTPTPQVNITDQQLRDAVSFKAGSYFIYQDSTIGRLDSFYVYTMPISGYMKDDVANVLYEQISYGARDSTQTANYQFVNAQAQQDRIIASTRIGGLFIDGMVMALPFTENTTKSYLEGNGLLVKHYASFTVLNVLYTDVYEVYSTDYHSQTNVHTWFSPNAGLIKFSVSGAKYNHPDINFCLSLKKSKALK